MKNKNKLFGSFQSLNCPLVCDRKWEMGKQGGKIKRLLHLHFRFLLIFTTYKPERF